VAKKKVLTVPHGRHSDPNSRERDCTAVQIVEGVEGLRRPSGSADDLPLTRSPLSERALSPLETGKRSYLVDPASSHMLVSKIKPCRSKYELKLSETANGSLHQLWFLRSSVSYLDNPGNSRANTCERSPRAGGVKAAGEEAFLLDQNQSGRKPRPLGESEQL
jgi:hypothetical protein